jgi:putative flippase GtrA
MSVKKLINKFGEQIRFIIVGAASTALDWGILFTLVALGLPALAGNFISTSVAMVFSFFTNKSFTFRVEKTGKKHFIYFIAITIVGMWVIQPIIIQGVTWLFGPILTHNCITNGLVGTFEPWFKSDYIVLFFAKGLATAASLTWNYLMYRKYVFNKN